MLEFKTTKILDLWSLLITSRQNNVEPIINAEIDLWTLIELIKKQKSEFVNIQNHKNGEVLGLGFEAIMQAFYQYIKSK